MALPVDDYLRSRFTADALGDGIPDVAAALRVGTYLSARGVFPGKGGMFGYLQTLATLGVVDATLARVVEPHLDACAIVRQAGAEVTSAPIHADESSTWGVFAANAPGFHLAATRDAKGTWSLTGTKPWCSLARVLSHAVITAEVPDRGQQAFAVRLDRDRVRRLSDPWVSRGLTRIPSGGIALRELPALPLGGPGWYLSRPGFSWGAIGVAAVWYGIAMGLQERQIRHATSGGADQIACAQLGVVDQNLFSAGAALNYAASYIDSGGAEDGLALLAARVRAVVADAAEDVLAMTGHALGPGPLTTEEDHARRVADLTVYVRQHHAERDLARLGELVVDGAGQHGA